MLFRKSTQVFNTVQDLSPQEQRLKELTQRCKILKKKKFTCKDDKKLCSLALNIGKTTLEIQTNIVLAFQWAWQGKMAQSLSHLKALTNFLAPLLQVVQNLKNNEDKYRVLAALAQSAIQLGEKEKGTQIFWQIQEDIKKYKLDSQDLIEAMAKTGDKKYLQWALKNIPLANFKGNIVKIVLQSLNSANFFDQIYNISQNIKDTLDRDQAMFYIVKAMAKKNLQRAIKCTQTIENKYWKSKALLNIALLAFQTGEKETALHICNQSLEIAQSIKEKRHQLDVLCEIIGAFAQAKLFSQALEIAQSFAEEQRLTSSIKNYKPYALHQIIKGMLYSLEKENKPGLWRQVLEVAQSINIWSGYCGRKASFSIVIEKLAQMDQADIFLDFIQQKNLPENQVKTLLEIWQQMLIKYVENPLSSIRHSLYILPQNYALSCHGVHMLLASQEK